MPVSYSDTEKFNRLRLIRTDSIGPNRFARLINRFGSATEAVAQFPTWSGKTKIKLPAEEDILSEIEGTHRLKAGFLHLGEKHYPHLLSQIDDAPPLLTFRGNVELLGQPSLAIVGARNASLQGKKLAARFAEVLGGHDYVITSGMARGIDTAAHEMALTTGTIAVIASGIDVVYPRENQPLYDQLTQSGLILTEMPLSSSPKAINFPRRNRIVSGLCQGVLVIEAALKSGSLITASLAAQQGRDVFAVPGSPLDPRSRGTNDLIRKGAILTETPDDIFYNLSPAATPQKPVIETENTVTRKTVSPIENTDAATSGTCTEKTVIELLGQSQVHIDEIAMHVDLDMTDFLALISELEISGKIVRLPGGLVSRV